MGEKNKQDYAMVNPFFGLGYQNATMVYFNLKIIEIEL